jgi:hypothetical protein
MAGLITDVAGVWPIHCHIGLHLSEGKMAAMVIQPDAVRKFKAPSDWQGVSLAHQGRVELTKAVCVF